jgi:hypothetical protein
MVDPVQAHEDNPEFKADPNIIVDQKLSQLPLCSCDRCTTIDCERNRPAKFRGYKRFAFKDANFMTEHQYFICGYSMNAFVLAVRQWSQCNSQFCRVTNADNHV